MNNRLPEILLQQWHPTKNVGLDSTQITTGSNKAVVWICNKSHEWSTSPASRTSKGKISSCPFCSGSKTLAGFNDLTTTHLHLAAQWSVKNQSLLPEQVSAGSNKKVWWQDEYGHEWEASVNNRTGKQSGCPFCSGLRTLSGFNDLVTTHPQLAAQWNSQKNGTLLPEQVSAGSNKKIWWQDEYGHEWEASVSNRALGKNCPVCANRRVKNGYNDLLSQHQKLATEWHPTKNGNVTPSDVVAGSHKSIWWLCGKGHEWSALIKERVYGASCPYCSGHKVMPGFNDLATTHPHLAAQWHSTKNGDLLSNSFSKGSEQQVVWVCEKNHEWSTTIYSRTGKLPTACPVCWSSTFVSKAEEEISSIVRALGYEVIQSCRSILPARQEIDIFIPEKQLGIEFNGLYWHSEWNKGRTYHSEKYLAARKEGIQLLQIWEDDWNKNRDVVIRALAHKLQATKRLAEIYPHLAPAAEKTFARATTVHTITTEQAKSFLKENHIQGFASGSYYLGLNDAAGVLRALMVLKKEAGETLNIVRYATAGSVTGGFTKLLRHAERTYQPKVFITFADHAISDGGLYESQGFVADKILPPDYMYVVKNQRKHKFGYRLKRFKNDNGLIWEEGLTEKELAILNNLSRIWDAGKTRYSKTVHNPDR